jgi:hypothetical protein
MTAAPPSPKAAPQSEEIEVSLFGPGFGECIVVHLGGGRWLIVDSCMDRAKKRPVALAYFDEIGVSPSSVELVLATHWHDDHVAGIDQVVSACTNAEFWCPISLRCPEFLQLVEIDLKRKGLRFTRGVKYIGALLEKTKFNFALASMRILQRKVSINGTDVAIEGWALSPSQAEHGLALRNLAELVETTGPETTIPDRNPNHCSIALALIVGDVQVLLGADLEETGNEDHGWSAVVASATRPHPFRASSFKISHHGSATGHLPAAWSVLTDGNPISILTPYRIGDNILPQATDVDRIVGLSKKAYITKRTYDRRPIRRSSAVAKLAPTTLRRLHETPGHIRLRKHILQNSDWDVALFDGATELSDFQS